MFMRLITTSVRPGHDQFSETQCSGLVRKPPYEVAGPRRTVISPLYPTAFCQRSQRTLWDQRKVGTSFKGPKNQVRTHK